MQTVTCIFIRSLLCSHWKHCKQTALDVPTKRSDFPIALISLLPAAFRLGFDRREQRASPTAWLQPEHLFNVHISQCLNHNHCWGVWSGWEHVCASYHHGSAVGTDDMARTSLDRILGCSPDNAPPLPMRYASSLSLWICYLGTWVTIYSELQMSNFSITSYMLPV